MFTLFVLELRDAQQPENPNVASSFLEKLFTADETRLKLKVSPQHASDLERQIGERFESKKAQKAMERSVEFGDERENEEEVEAASTALHPFANCWRKMMHAKMPGVPVWIGSLEEKSDSG